jgi:predicted transcriptional regulator
MSGIEMERALRRGKEYRLTATQRLLYVTLGFYKNQKTGECFPGTNELMLATGLGRTAIFDSVKSLEAKGLLICKRGRDGHSSNKYYFPETRPLDVPVRHADQSTDGDRHSGSTPGEQTSPPDEPKWSATRTEVVRHADPNKVFIKEKQQGFNKAKNHGSFSSKNQESKPQTDAIDEMITKLALDKNPSERRVWSEDEQRELKAAMDKLKAKRVEMGLEKRSSESG